jgi:hypothetical protein
MLRKRRRVEGKKGSGIFGYLEDNLMRIAKKTSEQQEGSFSFNPTYHFYTLNPGL